MRVLDVQDVSVQKFSEKHGHRSGLTGPGPSEQGHCGAFRTHNAQASKNPSLVEAQVTEPLLLLLFTHILIGLLHLLGAVLAPDEPPDVARESIHTVVAPEQIFLIRESASAPASHFRTKSQFRGQSHPSTSCPLRPPKNRSTCDLDW